MRSKQQIHVCVRRMHGKANVFLLGNVCIAQEGYVVMRFIKLGRLQSLSLALAVAKISTRDQSQGQQH